MKDTVQGFVDEVKNQGKKAIRSVMRDVARKVEVDFMLQASVCMDNYYREYIPTMYERTENLKYHGYHPYRRYRKNEIDVGVAFSSDQMSSYGNIDDGNETAENISGFSIEDLVVNNFMQGIHGNPSVYIGRHVDETMQHFTSAYTHFELDKYFEDNLEKYMV